MSLLAFGDPFNFNFPLLDFPALPPVRGEGWHHHANRQPIDIEEREDSYELYTDVPGVPTENIELEYNDQTQVLTVKAEHKIERKQDTGGFTRTERSKRSFQRSFTLPPDAEADAINANVENGVLNVHIPKKPPVTAVRAARRIAVTGVPHRSQIEGAARTDQPAHVTVSPLEQHAAASPLQHTAAAVGEPAAHARPVS